MLFPTFEARRFSLKNRIFSLFSHTYFTATTPHFSHKPFFVLFPLQCRKLVSLWLLRCVNDPLCDLHAPVLKRIVLCYSLYIIIICYFPLSFLSVLMRIIDWNDVRLQTPFGRLFKSLRCFRSVSYPVQKLRIFMALSCVNSPGLKTHPSMLRPINQNLMVTVVTSSF